MQEPRQNRPASNDGTASGTDDAPRERESGLHSGDRSDPDGWQQYRKWISTAPAPRTRRGSIDPTLYTWKGYRSWTEQIKRNWSDS
jgi:hypothetical protein